MAYGLEVTRPLYYCHSSCSDIKIFYSLYFVGSRLKIGLSQGKHDQDSPGHPSLLMTRIVQMKMKTSE